MRTLVISALALMLAACGSNYQLTAGKYSGPLCEDSQWHWAALAASGSRGGLSGLNGMACDADPATHGAWGPNGFWLRPDGTKVAANFYQQNPALFSEQLTATNAKWQ